MSKISALTELAEAPASTDEFVIVDKSDTTMAATGTTKRIQSQYVTIADASTTVKGKVELATDAETITGTDTVRAVTPSNLTGKIDTDGTLAGNSDTRIPSQKSVKTYGDRALNTLLTRIPLYAPQGFLINGKIVVTDAAGITVAIKTLAGTDPSATDPVYIRIGDTVRTISSALSVAKSDGTNYCNAGSAELATKEIDWFVYLYWYSTHVSGAQVGIAFARYPGANKFSDFNAASDNEKGVNYTYDGASTPAAGDNFEVIGRFAATLSAGAGYTWSVPTYTAINLIQRPIYETRWLSWLSAYSASGSMTFTSTAGAPRYKVRYSECFVNDSVGGTTGGSAGVALYGTLPFTASGDNGIACRAVDGAQKVGAGRIVSTNSIEVYTDGGGNWTLGAARGFAYNGFYLI